jgi:thiol:disulfide interchange protein DsbA
MIFFRRRLMNKCRLVILAMMMLISGGATAQMSYEQGKDYQLITPAVSTSQPDKVVVTEIFWYGCPHCFRFEPFVEHWAAGLPDGVVFEQVPSSLNERWKVHARAFYAFKLMGAHEQSHKALFDAIHLNRQRLNDIDSLAGFAGSIGLDEKQFRDSYASFPVETQIRKDNKKERRYGHRGVPAVIVNGKYLVSSSLAGSNERMIQIMNFLVAQELKQ